MIVKLVSSDGAIFKVSREDIKKSDFLSRAIRNDNFREGKSLQIHLNNILLSNLWIVEGRGNG